MGFFDDFQPAQLDVGDTVHVRETFYAAGIPVAAGIVVRVMSVNEHVEDRIYDLTIVLQTLEAPVQSFIWRRSHPLDQRYVDQILERITFS